MDFLCKAVHGCVLHQMGGLLYFVHGFAICIGFGVCFQSAILMDRVSAIPFCALSGNFPS